MLEPGGIGGVTGDGHVHVLLPHDGNTLGNAVCAIAVYLGAQSLGIRLAEHFFHGVGVGIILGLHICKAVDTGNNLRGILAQAV